MPTFYEIRADYDEDSIVVYQAYNPAIALPAVEHKTFVAPFSFNRMTWIKPSFLWMMERSNWGLKTDQECILAIRLTRQGWEEALRLAVLTSFEKTIYSSHEDWEAQFKKALVYVQWDPERSIHGKVLDYRSIQVGISRHIIDRYVKDWIIDIQDYTPLVRKLYNLIKSGHTDKAKAFLPKEKVYLVDDVIAKRLGIKADV